MSQSLRPLFVSPSRPWIERLSATLAPHFFFFDAEQAPTFPQALTVLLRGQFQLCFISEGLQADKRDLFLRDTRQMPGRDGLVFVLVKEKLSESAPRLIPFEGIECLISTSCSPADILALNQAMKPLAAKFHEQQVEEKMVDLSEAVTVLVRHIDEVARSRKRGARATFDPSISRFISSLAAFDQKILERYYELFGELQEPAPSGFERVRIPERILAARLPNFHGHTYSGPSTRVWKKVVSKYALRDEAPPASPKPEKE